MGTFWKLNGTPRLDDVYDVMYIISLFGLGEKYRSTRRSLADLRRRERADLRGDLYVTRRVVSYFGRSSTRFGHTHDNLTFI